MLDTKKELFKWGPIPGRLIYVSHWPIIFFYQYSDRLHNYIWPESILIFSKDKMFFSSETKKLEKAGARVFQEVLLTPKIKKIYRAWERIVGQLFSLCQNITDSRLAALSDKDLKRHWQQFNDLVYLFWEPGVIPELGAYGGEAILKRCLAQEELSSDEARKAFSILSAPVRKSFYQEEELDLLRVLERHGTKSFKISLHQHQQEYFWLENSYFSTKILRERFFIKRIQEKRRDKVRLIRVIKEIKKDLQSTQRTKERLIAHLDNRKVIKQVSDSLAYCIWWQDQRKKYIFRYLHYLTLFINEFARRSKLPPRLLDFAWVDEIRLNPPKKLVAEWRQRKAAGFAIHFSKKRVIYLAGTKARKIYRAYWPKKAKYDTNEFEGTVVYGTKKLVKAKVYIIKQISDIRKFPKGRILVTAMTAPEYISAIRKAKAIVTDTGGVTCHAAIVARELKVPCIVGTKIATQVLKNGDEVEVDAERGVVKKI